MPLWLVINYLFSKAFPAKLTLPTVNSIFAGLINKKCVIKDFSGF